jgi:FMN phosphatase YigB (HAD superfamily)
MQVLILDVLGVLVSEDSLLDCGEFLEICEDFKSKGGIILLFSNSTENITRNNPLQDFVLKYVDDSYFVDNGKPLKPSLESFEALLGSFESKPEECLYIDDGNRNIEVAKNLGFNTILYTNSGDVIEDIKSYQILK